MAHSYRIKIVKHNGSSLGVFENDKKFEMRDRNGKLVAYLSWDKELKEIRFNSLEYSLTRVDITPDKEAEIL